MDERQRLCEIGIQPQCARDRTRDLGHLERVRQTVSKMVGIPGGEDLGFGFEAPKRPRMDHAVAVARVVITVRVRRLGVAAPARSGHIHRIRSQRHAAILVHAMAHRQNYLSAETLGFRSCKEHIEAFLGFVGRR